MNKRNSRGPRTLPWGTSDWTGADDEVTPSRRTCFDLFPGKLLIQLEAASDTVEFQFMQ